MADYETQPLLHRLYLARPVRFREGSQHTEGKLLRVHRNGLAEVEIGQDAEGRSTLKFVPYDQLEFV